MNYYPFMTNQANANIVSCVIGDVNGDGIADHVYLAGIKTPDSPFIQNITLAIQDGRTGEGVNIPLKQNAGYNPTVYLYDVTGDGVYDILISIDTGGSGGTRYYYIYSLIHNTPRLLFDSDVYNQQYQYEVTYKDFYKVEVLSKKNNTKYIIDIAYKGTDYLNEIYDANGKLKNPISGFVDPISGLFPIDFNADRVYDLMAFQAIAGRYHADSLGYVQNILKWTNNGFVLDRQFVAIPGSQV